MRVASLVWTGYESLYLARSLGYYDGAPLRLVEMTSHAAVSHALHTGMVDAAAMTLDEALTLMQDGVDLRVVLVMDVSHGADMLLARPEITDLGSLRGKRIGVENVGNGALMLDAVLRAGKLSAGDIIQVPLKLDEQLAAYQSDKVDALVTFEPLASQLLHKGARLLFDSTRIPDRILDVLVVRSECIPRYQPVLKTLLAGHFRALDYLARQPGDAAARMAPRMGVSPGEVLPQFAGLRLPSLAENRQFLAGASPRLEAGAEELAGLMVRQQLLRRPVDVTHLADASFLPGAVR